MSNLPTFLYCRFSNSFARALFSLVFLVRASGISHITCSVSSAYTEGRSKGGGRGCAPPPPPEVTPNTIQSQSAVLFDMYPQNFTFCNCLVKSLLGIRF